MTRFRRLFVLSALGEVETGRRPVGEVLVAVVEDHGVVLMVDLRAVVAVAADDDPVDAGLIVLAGEAPVGC